MYRFEDVDIALVLESAGPFALVHDLIADNPELTFGVIHIAADSVTPSLPRNVRWTRTVPLQIGPRLRPNALNLPPNHRVALAHQLFDALEAAVADSSGPMWRLYDEAIGEATRHYPLWALLGSREFAQVVVERVPSVPMAEAFRRLDEAFSLAHALLGTEMPRAKIYHAQSTGYAALVCAAAARTHGGRFLLTSHSPPIRDTPWQIEMDRFCHPSADHITYLHASGAPTDHRVVMILRERVWRLAWTAPTTGLDAVIDAAGTLVSRGFTNWTLDVLGPFSAVALDRIEAHGLARHFTFRETVNVRAMLGDFDLLVVPSLENAAGAPIRRVEATTDALAEALTDLDRSESAHPDFFQSQQALAMYSELYRRAVGWGTGVDESPISRPDGHSSRPSR